MLFIATWIVVIIFVGNMYFLHTVTENTRHVPLIHEENVLLPILTPTRKTTSVEAQTTRAPISIIGDASFITANGVIEGNGNKSDPYIIANWIIDSNGVDNGIQIANTTSYFVIENCLLLDATASNSAGIQLSNVTNGHLRNNECKTSFYGICLVNSSFITLTNNTCNSNLWVGIRLEQNSRYNTLTNNTCKNNGNYGIVLYTGSSNNTMINNLCNLNNKGISLQPTSSNNTLTDNDCVDNHEYGIFLFSSSSNALIKNTCGNSKQNNWNTDHGIYLKDSSSNLLTNNICNYTYYSGILFENSSSNILTRNICYYQGFNIHEGRGIKLIGSSDSNTISLNILDNNGGSGIDISSSISNIIRWNWITNSGETINGTLITIFNNKVLENFFYYIGTEIKDHDGDGLADLQEMTLETHPMKADTDGDSFMDGYESTYGSDPLDVNDYPIPPHVVIISPTSSNYNQADISLTYIVSEGTVTILTNEIANNSAQPSGSTISGLTEGSNNITIVVVDHDVHIAKQTVIFIIDTTSTPQTSIFTSIIFETLTTWVSQTKATAEFATVAIFAGFIGVFWLKRRRRR
jgi:parallel beta-helix repeat protein